MRFMRFAAVGILNTLIDFGVLNGLLWLDGYHFGWRLLVYNGLAFAAASANSYVLNKRWTFDDPQPFSLGQAGLFLCLTLIGLAINCLIIILLTLPAISPRALSAATWVNLAKVAATFASLAWNYCSYRWWVFSGRSPNKISSAVAGSISPRYSP